MALNPDVVVVAPGELITAAHLNNIRSNLITLDNRFALYLPLAGGTVTGTTTFPNLFVAGAAVALAVGAHPGTGAGFRAEAGTGRLLGSVTGAAGVSSEPNLILGRGGAAANVGIGATFITFRGNTGSSGDPLLNLYGSISIASASSVAFNTTSDPRLKKRTGDAGDALAIVRTLGATVYRGRWLADEDNGEEWHFLNSTDAEPVVPYAVSGDAGATDENGNIEPQQLNLGALVPVLFAAVAQLAGEVEALRAGGAS